MRSRLGRDILLAAACLLASGLPAVAQSPSAPPVRQCFIAGEFGNWRAADARTVYIRVRMNKIFRLDMANECSLLLSPDARLITVFRGSDLICSPLDWDLKVNAGIGGNAVPCRVKAMTLLTLAEASALPKNIRP